MSSRQQSQEKHSGIDLSCMTPADVRQRFQEFPEYMIVVIDGWSNPELHRVGDVLSRVIGCVLIDSQRFFRTLTKACLDVGVDLADQKCVSGFCKTAALDVEFAVEDCKAVEASLSVNGKSFTKAELEPVEKYVALVSEIPEVREVVYGALRHCTNSRRAVVLGRCLGGQVFPETPFKYFRDSKRPEHSQGSVLYTTDALMVGFVFSTPERDCGMIVADMLEGGPNPEIRDRSD